MLFTRIYRITSLVLVVLRYLIKALFIHLFTTDSHVRRKKFAVNVFKSCKRALNCFNIKLSVIAPPINGKRFLIVSNHLGYFDIFAIASTIPTLFVTSVEMKETPFLGLLTEMGGCLYVERRSRNNIHNEIKEIESALNDGFNVVIFPEGRATNGEKVHPFKKSLLMACSESEANILPVVVNFENINGEQMQHKFRDWVCWYDDMSFLTSIWNASQINSCTLKLEFLSEVEVGKESNHKDVASKVQSQIEERYIQIKSPDANLNKSTIGAT